MTLERALERLDELADTLERLNQPEQTREAVLQTRMFTATIRSASVEGVALNDALADTLEVCRRLEYLIDVALESRFETAEGLEA